MYFTLWAMQSMFKFDPVKLIPRWTVGTSSLAGQVLVLEQVALQGEGMSYKADNLV